MTRGSDRWLAVTVSVCVAAVTLMLFGFRYPPSVDFPQHVAQLSAWVHFEDPAYGFAQQFEINLRTPYLLGYLLARPFVPLLGVIGALKIALLFATLANVAAYAFLLRTVEQDIWVSLLGFPLTFGFCFYFGFVNFLLATPLVVTAVTLALLYARRPRWQGGLSLAFVLAATLLTHGLAFVVATLTALVVYVGERGPSGRSSLRSLWPFILPTLAALPWLIGFGTTGVPSAHPFQWMPGGLSGLLLYVVTRTLGFWENVVSGGGIDPIAGVYAVCIFVVGALSLSRYSTSSHRWALYGVAMGAHLFAPFQVLGVAYVYQRFAGLVFPGMILLAGQSAPVLTPGKRRPLLVLLSLGWLGILILRTRAFNLEAGEFDDAIANLPPALRVRPLIVAATGEAIPDVPVYMHFPAYYQAERGGYLGHSFARYPTTLVRYRKGVDIGMADDQDWNTQLFDAPREVPRYNCFMIRADRDVGPSMFRDAPKPLRLATHVGKWWLYRVDD